MAEFQEDEVLDCRSQLCPVPVVRAGRSMRGLEPGKVLKILTTDRGAVADFPAWARDTGNEILGWNEDGGVLAFFVRKGSGEED